MQRERACCPMCSETLPLLTRRVQGLVVPNNERRAPYDGPGEVVRRSSLRAETVRGRREVVQDVHVWLGSYDTSWVPFCSATCAARFGIMAYRGSPTLRPPERISLPEQAGKSSRSLAERFGLLLESTAGPEVGQVSRLALESQQVPGRVDRYVSRRAERYAPGTPGHPDWHPPDKPPPVPGVFRYDAGGYRLSDTPEAIAARQAQAERMRQVRWAKRAAAGKPTRLRANGYHHEGPDT